MVKLLLALGLIAPGQDMPTNYDLTVECAVLATAGAESLERAEPATAPPVRQMAAAAMKLVRNHAAVRSMTADQASALVEQRLQPYRNAFAKVSNPTDYRNAALNLAKKATGKCRAVIENWKRFDAAH